MSDESKESYQERDEHRKRVFYTGQALTAEEELARIQQLAVEAKARGYVTALEALRLADENMEAKIRCGLPLPRPFARA